MPDAAYRKKLIEVALPLDAINAASSREKSIRHGHPSTLHLWWSRKPLATARAVLFAQIVDDPASVPEEFPTLEAQEAERERLFGVIRELVKWENTTNEGVLHKARVEIARSVLRAAGQTPPYAMTPDEVKDALAKYAPQALDPFAGGGSIPLEAQRLGLEAHASDLNPVAVLINKAMIELPARFAGRAPVNPQARAQYMDSAWKGAAGLAADVRYYGQWMRDEAFKRIGQLYPNVRLPKEQGGGEATVIAWLWARTVTCPNPACGAQAPLTSKWTLSTKRGKETWVEPVIDREATPPTLRYVIRQGAGAPTGTVNRTGVRCIVCGSNIPFDYVRAEGKAGRMGAQMLAIVAEGMGGRAYVAPDEAHIATAESATPEWKPDAVLPHNPRDFKTPNYGMKTFGDLFTPRQLMALTTFSDLVGEARARVLADGGAEDYADKDGLVQKSRSLALTRSREDEFDVACYADAIATYLACALDRFADSGCTLATWQSVGDYVAHAFGRQALPMVWDYAEVNPFSSSTRNFYDGVEWVAECLEKAPENARVASVHQRDATEMVNGIAHPLISTDPPYYDAIGYADLSDFFYVWLRRSLGSVYPDLFRTLLTPKTNELVATPYRFGGSTDAARHFFEEGLGKAFVNMRGKGDPAYPLTIYYALKQSENEASEDGANGAEDAQSDELALSGNGRNGRKSSQSDMLVTASTGWETMLTGLLNANFSITGTWPVRSERGARMNSLGTNALASSIVLVCRLRPADAPIATRREFMTALKQELPRALRDLQSGGVAPVDLAQAAIGPGMAVFSRYRRVMESDGSPMSVRAALQVINQTLDETLAEQEGDYDAETRWAVAWFEQSGVNEGPYGVAETLSKAKNIALKSLEERGLIVMKGGKVRLIRRDELTPNDKFFADWTPAKAARLTVWEVMQRLIFAIDKEGVEQASQVLDRVGGLGGQARDLAYRLYVVCERKRWADEALAYNTLVVEWGEIAGGAERQARQGASQGVLL